MTPTELETVKRVLMATGPFKDQFLHASSDKERRMIIHDCIEYNFGKPARNDSKLAERDELAAYFLQQFNSANSGTTAVPTEEIYMDSLSTPVAAIETKTYIFGQLAANVSDDQIFDQVANIEAQIEHLSKTQNKSNKLVAKIEALNADIKALNDFVDARP